MGVLFKIGKGSIPAEYIDDLLDIEKTPEMPLLDLAPE